MTPDAAERRARALLDGATPGPWTHERVGYGQHAVTPDARSEIFVEREGDAALMAAAPDLARGLVAAVDALRAEREARAVAEFQREAYRADAHRLAAANGRLVDEADAAQCGRRAAEAQRDALAAAVREERRLKALHRAALHEEISAAILDTDSDRENAAMAESRETAEAAEDATAHLDALLSGAAPDVVRAGVVRDFLRAHDRVPWAVFCDGPQLEREAEARAALDAALAAVKETP